MPAPALAPKPLTDALAALAKGAPQIHTEAPGNLILVGTHKTADFEATWKAAYKIIHLIEGDVNLNDYL